MPRPELSLCLIIRDEQEMLPEFLAAVDGLWDELVVADTGSRDNSLTLLEAAGAKVVHFPWIDDFAAARNASLELATGRWILFLDADERPTEKLAAQIRQLLDDEQAGAATVTLENLWPDGTRHRSSLLRLFRNDGGIRFRYRIHEDISHDVHRYLQAHNLKLRHLDGVVIHLGYSRQVAAERHKKTRDLELLQRALQDEPRDFYCWFKILEIARFWADAPLGEKTAAEVIELLKNLTPDEVMELKQRPFSGEFAHLVAQGMAATDNQRLLWLEQSANYVHPGTTWHLGRALLLENLGREKDARQAFEASLQTAEESNAPPATVRPRLGLCRLALGRGDIPEAIVQATEAARINPRDAEAQLICSNLAETLLGAGKVKEAAGLLEPTASCDPSAALGYLVCCLCLGQDLDLQVDVEQAEADRLLKGWISRLWDSRNTEMMGNFADGCSSVVDLFEWLPQFLADETLRLKA